MDILTWAAELERLDAEWQAVLETQRAHRDREARLVATRWHDALQAMAVEHAQLVAQGRWVRGPPDFFGVHGLGRSELHHSAMLAWLLEPTGRHGLGDSLLRMTLARWFPKVAGPGAVQRIATEVGRDDTRADIVVWATGCTLVIENEVDAAEGWRQCDRLFEQFSREPGALFLFLTPDGTRPHTASGAAAEAFAAASWREVRCALAEGQRSLATHEGAGTIVDHYLTTLREQFG